MSRPPPTSPPSTFGQLGLVTHYILFLIDLAPRAVHVAGITPNPDERFMAQVARNLTDCIVSARSTHSANLRPNPRSGQVTVAETCCAFQERGVRDAGASPDASRCSMSL